MDKRHIQHMARSYTHRVLFHGELWSRHSSYKLAQKGIDKAVSRFAYKPESFTIEEI